MSCCQASRIVVHLRRAVLRFPVIAQVSTLGHWTRSDRMCVALAPAQIWPREDRRSFASKKGKVRGREVGEDSMATGTQQLDISAFQRRMDESLNALKKELATLRTGRANPALLDTVQVQAYGSTVSLSTVAQVSARDAQSLVVNVFDKQLISSVSKGIKESGLSLNPTIEHTIIRVQIPKPSKDVRDDLVRQAQKHSEQAKVSIRRVRQDGMQDLKKLENAKAASEDDVRKQEKQLQTLTDDFVKKAGDLCSAKEKEILAS